MKSSREQTLRGGVAISYRDKYKQFKKTDIFVYYPELLSLVDKVKKTNFAPLSELVFAQSGLRFTETMYSEHPEIEKRSLISKESRYNLRTNIFNKLENITFFSKKPADEDKYVQIYGLKNTERKYM